MPANQVFDRKNNNCVGGNISPNVLTRILARREEGAESKLNSGIIIIDETSFILERTKENINTVICIE
jgi:hypothetical protein